VPGNYRTQLWDKQSESFLPSTPGLGMHVEVKDPDGKVVMSRQYGSEGRFTFTSHTPGEHQICLHSNSTRMALFAGGKL
ncbi:TMED4 protein, partial [Agelaius phoeniceus]|nr:TMED4 protein [Agelaius phoeniceus]NXL26660.1 TMED4 protein [Setophaga kirtlandii]NXQ68981.1 TMED4 protein [Quiscalus mexicanus]